MAAENLGKAVLDLEANLEPFRRNMAEGKRSAQGMQGSLDDLSAISEIAERALSRVKMGGGQALESGRTASSILDGVKGISDEAREAARHLDHVKLTEVEAAETRVAADSEARSLNKIERAANRAKRALDGLHLATALPALRTTGRGVGPFGSGYGRIGVLGTAIGVGALTAPAAGPALAGLAAGIPALAAGGAGALGTLILAFRGVGKAISGDKRAFDALQPSQKQFVLTIRSMTGWVDRLKQTAAGNLFPGLTAGIKSALSVGTVSQITKAVTEFARAIGAAGQAWGKYFGSTQFQHIFGPLMQAGARNLGVMSDAAMNLFDSLGVLGRAGIPLVNWLSDAADRGSRLVDTFLRARDASGGLARAVTEAQSSLVLIGHLVEALGRAVGALGGALYPVARVAVRDLTDGLNGLARVIQNNQTTIRDLVGAFVSGLKTIVEVVSASLGAISGAWDAVFGTGGSLVAGVTALSTALTIAMGPEAAAIVGAVLAAGYIRDHWDAVAKAVHGATDALHGFGSVVVGPAAIAIGATFLGWALNLGKAEKKSAGLLKNLRSIKFLGPIAVVVTVDEIIHKLTGSGADLSQGTTPDTIVRGTYKGRNVRAIKGTGAGDAVEALDAGSTLTARQKATLLRLITAGHAFGFPGALAAGHASSSAASAAAVAAAAVPGIGAGTGAASKPSDSVFGKPPPFTKNVPKPKAPKVVDPAALTARLQYALSLAGTTPGQGDDKTALGAAIKYLRDKLAGTKNLGKRSTILDAISGYQGSLAGIISGQEAASKAAQARLAAANAKIRAENAKRMAALDKELKAGQAYTQSFIARIGEIAKLRAAAAKAAALREQNARLAHGQSILGIGDYGIPGRAALQHALDAITKGPHANDLTKADLSSIAKINQVNRLFKDKLLPPDIRQNIQQRIASINANLRGLSKGLDGFDLTAADRRRRFLDSHFADTYGGKADHPKTVTYAPTFHVANAADAARKDRVEFFKFRQLMPT